MSEEFKTSAIERLNSFLRKSNQTEQFEPLTPDASTREFFRVEWNNQSAIACVYPEQFDESLPQLDVTNLFIKSNLPVAEILETDLENGLVLHHDFGDKLLKTVLETTEPKKREVLINKAIKLIAHIQNSTKNAFELNSIASKLKFDEEKLNWELDFFKTHYFESLSNIALSDAEANSLNEEFTELSKELERYAMVLTHRDFHSANLMLDENEGLKIIDHQDARLGSVAYDLVSLLLDRITTLPSQVWLKEKKLLLLDERVKLGLESIEFDKFDYEFELMTVQRCLKAIGTFSNQAGVFGRKQYIPFINPMFQVVLEACQRLNKFPHLQKTINIILY